MLAPRHERVFELPSARREPIAVVTGYNRLQATIGWFRWLTKDGVGSLHDVTQEHCDRYLIQRLESGMSAQRMMAEVAVLKDLARYGELFTTDRYRRGFEPWFGKSAAAVAGVSSSATGNTTPVVPEHILRPALHAALYLVDCIGPRLVDLLDRLRARQAEPTVHGWPRPAELTTAMADRVASRSPLPQTDAQVVRQRLADGWAPDDPLLQLSVSEFFRDLGRRQMPSSYLDRARPLLVGVARAVGFAPCWERGAVEVDRADSA